MNKKMSETNVKKSGFTLTELLVVIAIISILGSFVIVALQGARDGAKSAKAAKDMESIYKAMLVMNVDTEYYPNNLTYLCEPLDEISETNEFVVSDANAGFVTNGQGWSGWAGPYLSAIPTDPWGNEYYFDDDYECLSSTQGCGGVDDGGDLNTGAIVSCGPNGALSAGSCSYDEDNIVRVLCKR